jgi:isopentenyl diphosphate isomerase/L-lactate dehydrogenase-like FMN-dependent dehydrogenase
LRYARSPVTFATAATAVRRIQIIQKELDTSMALCGVRNVADLDRSVILNPY